MRPPRALATGIALVLTAGALLWAPPAASSQTVGGKPQPARPDFVPGELLVRFRPGAPPAERAAVRARHGLTTARTLPLPGLELARIRGRGRPPDVALRVRGEAAVRSAEPNFLWYPDQIPNDPEFDELWGLHNTGGNGKVEDADIDAPEAWAMAEDSSDIVVAVIDTGVWTDHPDLQDAIWTNPGEIPGNGVDDDLNGYVDDVHGWDFFNDDATVFDANQPDDHGTHVAGTIAATIDNAMNVAGASRARIMPLKFLGPQGGPTSDAIRAIDYAIDNGAHLTNNSWGGGDESPALQAKIEEANAAGQLFVAAAGNDGVDNDASPHYPSSYPNDNVIAVAATTDDDELASFSNYGNDSVDLGAPGQSILSTVPRFAKAVLVGPDTGASVDHRSAYHTFGLEGVSSSAHRQDILFAALDWMEVSTADLILLVDDDRGAGHQTAYSDALTDLGFDTPTTFTVSTPGCNNGPSAPTMAGYDAVIWFTGQDWGCTLTDTDQDRLQTYLSGGAGRNLLLFGQDIGYDLIEDAEVPSNFIKDTLRADYVTDIDRNFRPSGVAGTPYGTVPTVELTQSGSGSQFFSSALEPRSGAIAGMRGAPTTWFGGTSMAAPHVAGAAALVMATYPSMSHLEVKERLVGAGDPSPALAGRTVSGRRLNAFHALDTTPPTAELEPLKRYQRARGFRVSWDGDDDGSDIEAFRVEIREARVKGAWSSWSEWKTTSARSAKFHGKPGSTYCFRVTAIDFAGNSSQRKADCTAVPANDRSFTRKGNWKKRTASGSYLGTFTLSKRRGDRLIVGRIKARELTLVTTRCPRCGTVEVRFRGQVIRRLSLKAPRRQRLAMRRVVRFDSVRGGKLVISVRSKGRRVAIEGVGVSRT